VNANGLLCPRFTPQPDNSSATSISQLQTEHRRAMTYRQKHISGEAIAVPDKGNRSIALSRRGTL
jgi:hypothetical protein